MRSNLQVLALILATIARLEGVLAQDPAVQGQAPPAAGGFTLDPSVISSNANSNGNPSGGQAASLTSDKNFIDFCIGKTITNGIQNQLGSCNPTPMGDIPAKDRMISTIITQPANGANLEPNVPFVVELQTSNMQAGSFTNPDVTYYNAPQQLANGVVVGHAHVTIQDTGDGTAPPDPATFRFFKGINDAGNGQGLLSTQVTDGLPAGNYRVCTMMSASNHQPVLMPVAQRGAQDDCIRITVGGQAAPPAAPPVEGQPPADGQQPPADGQQPPADGQQPPADGQQPPADGQQPPADGQQPPADGQQPPADGQQPPADGQQPPADGQQPPADGQQPPADGQQPPADGQQPPADGQQPPADGQQPPADGQQPPADGQNGQNGQNGQDGQNGQNGQNGQDGQNGQPGNGENGRGGRFGGN